MSAGLRPASVASVAPNAEPAATLVAVRLAAFANPYPIRGAMASAARMATGWTAPRTAPAAPKPTTASGDMANGRMPAAKLPASVVSGYFSAA